MAKRSFYQLVWRELHWQRPYTQEQVCDILSHLASTIPRGAIIWEARGHGGYVKHIIGADAAYIRRIESVMKAHGDIRFYPLEEYHRAPVSAARQLVISHMPTRESSSRPMNRWSSPHTATALRKSHLAHRAGRAVLWMSWKAGWSKLRTNTTRWLRSPDGR